MKKLLWLIVLLPFLQAQSCAEVVALANTTAQNNLPLICDYGQKSHDAFILTDAFVQGRLPPKVRVIEAKSYVTLMYICQGDPSKVTAFDVVTRAYQAYVAIKAAEREAAAI